MIGILEDDLDGRQVRFREALKDLGPAIYHDNAPDFLCWLGEHLASLRLLSLDHDLGPSRDLNGERFDPGEGMQIVDFLVTRPPACPIIVHSSNSDASQTMVRRLEEAGWPAERIVPWGDDWIGTVWLARVRQLLGKGGVPQ
jgi:Cyclic-phosphate processing Receiver domain